MGDRANFAFKQSNGETIVLYGHWAGHNMLANLANAVDTARGRWADESYATRICISQLVGDDWNSETGWGLQVNSISDNEHKIPLIDWSTQTFSLHEESSWSEETKVRGMSDTPIFDMSLDSFIKKYSPALV
jgi:hypothetical protein